jgi:hypothetical protein
MYTKLYPEMMSKVPTVEAVVRGVWDLLGAGKLGGVADDGVRPSLSRSAGLELTVINLVCFAISSIYLKYHPLWSLQAAIRHS